MFENPTLASALSASFENMIQDNRLPEMIILHWSPNANNNATAGTTSEFVLPTLNGECTISQWGNSFDVPDKTQPLVKVAQVRSLMAFVQCTIENSNEQTSNAITPLLRFKNFNGTVSDLARLRNNAAEVGKRVNFSMFGGLGEIRPLNLTDRAEIFLNTNAFAKISDLNLMIIAFK